MFFSLRFLISISSTVRLFLLFVSLFVAFGVIKKPNQNVVVLIVVVVIRTTTSKKCRAESQISHSSGPLFFFARRRCRLFLSPATTKQLKQQARQSSS